MPFRSGRGLVAALSLAALAGCGRGGGSQATSVASSASPLAGAGSAAPDAAVFKDQTVQEGARLYDHYCKLCHAKDATGYAADNAPSLVSQTFLESAPDDQIATGIRMGRPGTAMAAYGKERGGPLEEVEISKIVRFLRSIPNISTRSLPSSRDGDVKRGAEVFEKNCQTCHGNLTMRGNAVSLQNPELLAAASPAFLRYAVMNGRPPTPMPAFKDKLEEQQIDDAVAFLWSFKPALPTPEVQERTVPKDLPIVINPKGGKPQFTLREERFVSAEQVKKALDKKQRIIIIDARPASDWIQFHIPGAISGPYHDTETLGKVPNDGTWVVAYCACPHHASGEVVDALRAKKYENTAVLDEGILFWKDHGYPVVGEAIKPGTSPSASAKPKTAPAPAH